MTIMLMKKSRTYFPNILSHSYFLNNKNHEFTDKNDRKTWRHLMVSNKQTNANITLHAFPLYPSHHTCNYKISFLFPGQRCTPQFTPRPITKISTLRVVTRVPSVTGKSVLYVISWRIKSYAHTVLIVLEAVCDPKVLSPGL
jgi:hypothetical protein